MPLPIARRERRSSVSYRPAKRPANGSAGGAALPASSRIGDRGARSRAATTGRLRQRGQSDAAAAARVRTPPHRSPRATSPRSPRAPRRDGPGCLSLRKGSATRVPRCATRAAANARGRAIPPPAPGAAHVAGGACRHVAPASSVLVPDSQRAPIEFGAGETGLDSNFCRGFAHTEFGERSAQPPINLRLVWFAACWRSDDDHRLAARRAPAAVVSGELDQPVAADLLMQFGQLARNGRRPIAQGDCHIVQRVGESRCGLKEYQAGLYGGPAFERTPPRRLPRRQEAAEEERIGGQA